MLMTLFASSVSTVDAACGSADVPTAPSSEKGSSMARAACEMSGPLWCPDCFDATMIKTAITTAAALSPKIASHWPILLNNR